MNRNSLRLRLLLGAAVTILLALILAWVVMSLLFTRHIEHRVGNELTRQAEVLVAGLSLSPAGVPLLDNPPTDTRFDLPSSGLYWQLSTAAGSLHSRSLWDESLPPATLVESEHWTTRSARGPFGQDVFLLERIVRHDPDAAPITVQLALDESEVLAARKEFAVELGAFLAVLWLALLTAAWVQVALGLRPLATIRKELSTLQGNSEARLHDRHPREIQPLTTAINELAEAREKDIARARRRASDLAHSLKTPLAALGAQSRRAREAGAVAAADGLDRAIASAAAAVETELARSRAAGLRGRASTRESLPRAIAERIIGVVERTESGSRLVFEVDIDDTLAIAIADEDLMEILGALIENASRFARRLVRVSGCRTAEGAELTVEDDGQGLNIPAEQALMRGVRLDEAGHNHHGLGLSIVRDLVEATGGEVALGTSALGGLQASLSWKSRPAPRV